MAEERQDHAGETGDQAKAQVKDLDVGEYVESFSALKDSLFQGHDLRKQQRDLDSYASETQRHRETHADRANILQNYDAIVAEQEEAIRRAQEKLDANRPELEKANAALSEAQGRLDTMKSEHKGALATLKKRNDRTEKSLEKVLADAKDARKRAEEQYGATAKTKEGVASDQRERFKKVLDDARAQEREANDALKDARASAKQMYRDKKQACDDEERPVQDQIAKLRAEQRRLQDEMAEQQNAISDAQERLEYCRQVKEDPSATDALEAQIAEREDVEHQMRGRIDSLAETHARSKERSKKARIVVVVAAVIIVAVLIAVIVAANR